MEKELQTALSHLKNGGIILYPTDTVWGLGCDATNASAIQRIYKLKQRAETKSMICLVDSLNMLERHVSKVPDMAYEIMKLATKPTTIIYDNPRGIDQSLVAADNSIAIRLTSNAFCKALIQKLRKPLVSTSANISGNPAPSSFKEIDDDILKGVDYVVNLQSQNKGSKPSSIIRLKNNGIVEVIRA